MDLGFLLAQASHVLMTKLTAELATLGVTPRANCVLSGAMTGERTQIQLADMCQLDKTTMVVTVDELEKAGLVERQTSATDRRARIIAVTELGQKVHAAGRDVVARVYEDVLSALPDEQRAVFLSSLTHLVETSLSTPVQCERAPRRRT